MTDPTLRRLHIRAAMYEALRCCRPPRGDGLAAPPEPAPTAPLDQARRDEAEEVSPVSA